MTSLIITLILIAYYLLVIGIAFGVILDNRNPAKTLAYLLVLLFVPVVGLVVYYMFGRIYASKNCFPEKAC